MASQAFHLQSSICVEKRRLIEEFYAATRAVVGIHSSEIAELKTGGTGAKSSLALIEARQRRDNASAALLLHTEAHGC